MRHIAIIGSGPAGYYTAEAALKLWGPDVTVDIFDRLPVPYGLIRSGVAPDHQSIKGVARRFEATALAEKVRFIGNVTVGRDVSVAELQQLYHAVVLATGAPRDRTLDLPGDRLGNVFGSAEFVGWYNGHPEFASLAPDLTGETAVVIGMGNVALDVARILAKTPEEFVGSDIVGHALKALGRSRIRRIVILGRRGPHQVMMTPKELGELGHLARAVPHVDPADLPDEAGDLALEPGIRKSVSLLRQFAQIHAPSSPNPAAESAVTIEFAFFAAPIALLGAATGAGMGRVGAVEIERTRIADGRAVGTGVFETLPASLVVSCIGYRTSPIIGVPFDERAGRFANDDGRILPGLYCVGWAKRGPSGTIGTNRPDGTGVVDMIAGDLGKALSAREGPAGFDALAASRNLAVVTFDNWKTIERAEGTLARSGAPREKFVDVVAMIRARG